MARPTTATAQGKKRRAFYGRTRAEVRGKMLEALGQQASGGIAFDACKLTFGEFLDR